MEIQPIISLYNDRPTNTTNTEPAAPGLDSLGKVQPLSSIYDDRKSEQPEQKPDSTKKATGPIDESMVSGVASREGLTPTQTRVMAALLGQESGNGRNTATSTDGARGAGQIMPGTFKLYAKPGESIDNQDHNLAVMARIVKDLGTKFGDDPAKIATGYFSGEGNVGKDSPWKNDRADGNGKRVSSYVSDVLNRLGAIPEAKAEEPKAQLPNLANIPKWGEIANGKKFQSLDSAQQQELKAKYFDEVLAPHAKAAGANVEQEREKFLTTAPQGRTWGQAASDTAVQLAEGVNTIAGAVPNLIAPESKVSQFFNENAEFWRGKQSEPLQQRIKSASAAIDKAGEDGVTAQIAEAASQYFSDPGLAARFVVTNLPSMIPGIGAAKLSQAAALARGATAAKAASVATTAAGATNAVLNAGGARGEAFEDIKKTLVAQGYTPEQAEEMAIKDSRLVAAIGAAAGYISGKTGLEKAVVGGAVKQGTTKGAVKAGVGSALGELAGEQIEEVSPQIATNYQASQYDNRSLGKDVGRTIVETAIGSGPGAVVGGGISAIDAKEAPTPDGRIEPTMGASTPAATAAPAQEAGAPAVNAPTATASNIQPPVAATEQPLPSGEAATDADVLEFAQTRLEALQDKIAGQDEEKENTGTLLPAEQDELRQLQAAGNDPKKLRQLYGFNQSQENQNAQTQGQGQATGPARGQDAEGSNGLASGAIDLGSNQPGGEAGGAQGSAEAGQRHQGLPAQGTLTPENEQAINGWLDSIGENDPAMRQQVLQQAATDQQALDAFLAQAEAAQEREAIQSEQTVQDEQQPAIPQPEELPAPVAEEAKPAPEKAPAFTKKEIPAMTDEELVAAHDYYSKLGHKRTAKLEKEINKRALQKDQANGTQAAEAPLPPVQEEAREGAPLSDYGQLNLQQFQEQHPNPYKVQSGILTTDLTKLSDQEVTDRFTRDDLVKMASLLNTNVSGNKSDLLASIRKVQSNRDRMKDMTREKLEAKTVGELRALVTSLGGNGKYLGKDDLVDFAAKWRDNSIKHTRNMVAESNHAREVVRAVASGNQNISDENIRRYNRELWNVVDPNTQKDLYQKVLKQRAMKDFAPPLNDIPTVVASYREQADRTKNDVHAQKLNDLADALEAHYTKFEANSAKAKPKTEKEAKARKEQAKPDVTLTNEGDIDAELNDALAHLGEVLSDVFQPKSSVVPNKFSAGDLLPALSKVVELLVRKGFTKFADATAQAAKAMRGNEKTAPFVGSISARQWKAAYNAVAEFHEGTDSEESVNALTTEDVLAAAGVGQKVEKDSTAQDLYTADGKFKVAGKVAKLLTDGGSFKTIVEARKFIGDQIGKKIEPATELAKQADEAIETGVVLAARQIVRAGRKAKEDSKAIYDKLVDLYDRQPNLAVRSSTSVRDQAYSTPVPLAYLASELAGITYDSKVLEPTAGNGMLVIGSSYENATVNELNPKRADMLKIMGFDAKTDNAATGTLAPAKSQDAVIANPPFGITKDANGETIVYTIKPNYGTREVDHAIAFKALDTMKDDGRAVLIVGGSNAQTDEGRQEDYRGKNKRAFYFNLYNDYNVVDHFTVDGSLYSKQGASYPVDVIVIEGRGKSQRDLPAADLPKVIGSYEELKEKLNGTGSVGTEGVRSPAGTDSRQDQAGASDQGAVVGSPVGSDSGSGNEGGREGNSAGVSDAGRADDGKARGSRAESGAAQPAATNQSESGDAGARPISSDRGRAKSGNEGRAESGSDGLGGTSVVDGERVESGLTDRRGAEQETAGQVSYTPHSGANSVGTLVPRAMRDAIDASLQKLEDQVGNLDDYVADRLEMDVDTVRTNFSAEQVDALALAIKNAEEGRGFIIGDQTGIGKGRVVAAMIKYALVNGKTPIFVTEKPNLYADMIRDLDDIEMTDELGLDTKKPRILMTNNGDPVPYTLLRTVNGEVTETNLTLRAPKSDAKAMAKVLKGMIDGDSLGDYKVIFTTYNQLQTQKGKVTERMNLVKHFGAGNYMIFDESHNAGGAGETQARTKEQRQKEKEGDSLATGRAAFVRALVNSAYGTFFSSATYAKRPEVMDLYSSTNMKLAVDRISQLGEAIKHGGVPMQQVVANMLTTDGQYIRRERTFAGVSYDTVETKVDKKTAENMSTAMRKVLAFSRAKDKVVRNIQKEMDKEGAMVREMGGEKATIQGANFGSIMHNLIDQMLLSLKVQESITHAIDRLKAGEKVVLTVSNTMGSFIEDYAAEMGLNAGDPVALTFADLYQRYLEKQRYVTIKDANGNKTQRRLSDEELGPQLVKMFADTGAWIRDAGFGQAPISPIDYMHAELRKAGYKTDEITGRTNGISYEGGSPKLSTRKADIKQRLAAISGFNGGEIDVLILNQSGSTGLSLHANSKFKDQRKRHMIIVQAEKNIDTHMQMLGRVHRTGQVIAPAYSQMMADVPAEMRPAAVLLKKMASLNANTTASRTSSVTAEGVVDFMNDYGGQVVHEYLRDNPDVLEAVGGSKVMELTDDSSDAGEDLIRKFTGYVPILPIKQQEEIYKDLIDRYNELLDRENTMGTNKLEAKAVDLDAEIVSSKTITEDKGDPSIFASPANMERIDVKRTVKPYSSKEVLDMVDERLGDKTGAAVASEQIKDLTERAKKYAQDRLDKMNADEVNPLTIQAQLNHMDMVYANTKAVLDNYSIGDSIMLKDKLGMLVYGVITDIHAAKRTANPAAGSDWKMHIALANGDAKSLSITFSQIGSKYELSRERSVNWYNPETQQAEYIPLINVFDKGATARREKRWMVTGNILAGFAKYPGQIITYTKKDGSTAQGVLMSRQFDFDKEMKNAPVRLKSGNDAVKLIDDHRATIGTEDGTLKVTYQGNTYVFTVPSSKKDGGTYYLDQKLTEITGDFYKKGGVMQARLYYAGDAANAIDYLMHDREEPIVALTQADKAREMMGEPKFQDIGRGNAFSDLPKQKRVNLQGKIDKLNKQVEAGKMTDAEFRLAVMELHKQLKDIADDKKVEAYSKGRRRGADWIIAKLRRGVADGTVPRGEAEFVEWLLGQNPNVAERLGISITEKDNSNARGEYFPTMQVFKLYANNLDEDKGTAVHEILHHTERMLPIEVQEAILSEWQKQWDKTYAKATPKEKAAMRDMLEASFGGREAGEKVAKHFGDGTLTYDKHYQFYSPSEFWAVNGTRILSGRAQASGSWVKQAIQWFKEFIEKFKGAFGLRSDAPIIKALNGVLKSDGNPQSSMMILERDYSGWLQQNEIMFEEDAKAEPSFKDISVKAVRDAVQFFGNKRELRTFGAYDKSLSTQFNKALKDEHYGKVFAFVNAMQNEVSLTSIRPSELAPGILQKVDDFKSAAKVLVTGRARDKSLKGATNALLAGTLNGDNVLDGKVWSEEELRNNFGLDDAGVGLYQQARAAIDASLDELSAAECYALSQGFVPRNVRRQIIDDPKRANNVIFSAMHKAVKLLNTALQNAKDQKAGPERIEYLEASIKAYMDTEEKIKAVLAKARDLKAAGYMPLMRFGDYTVTVKRIDPTTGYAMKNDNGESMVEYFGTFETQAEANATYDKMRALHADDASYSVTAGVKSNEGYKLYQGISPETVALFAEAVGADSAVKAYYKEALSERSALKRKLDRKGIAGFSDDLPRVMANFITSNGRFAAQRYYMRDLTNAIKFIPQEKGDVKDEAIKLKEFIMNPNDPAAPVSAALFAWFLGGSVASAAINLSQPILMTGPYLSQFGFATASKAMAKALPMALGKKQITDANLRKALKRASQEGIVEAQEIFHLYSQGAQGVSTQLANAVSKIPGVGNKLKSGTESMRARTEAFFTLWGMMFSVAESFNRKLTFLAAWEVAIQNKESNPYAFAVRAVNETQGIYNKANRPNWARGAVGRTVLTFKQFSLMYVELLKRMATKGGPQGKKAALMMLAMLLLAAGEEGLPFMQDIDDIIDTVGQFFGYNTNMKRSKRRWAHETLGKEWGDLFLYGVSSKLPLDFSGRLGLGNLIPGTGFLKASSEGNKMREVTEVVGPVGSLVQQVNDAIEAGRDRNFKKAFENVAPKAAKDLMAGIGMADKGYATDSKGLKNMDVTLADAVVKSVGFNPTRLAEASRARAPGMQDAALQKNTESAIVDMWGRGIAQNDQEMINKAIAKRDEWNRDNPKTQVQIKREQIQKKARDYNTDQNTRIIKSAPRELRGQVGLDLAK